MSFSPLALRQEEFSQAVFRELGKGRIHAGLLYTEWMRYGSLDGEVPAFTNANRLKQAIIALINPDLPPIVLQKYEGKVQKFLLDVGDRLRTETVLIPMEAGATLCVSSQVGCQMGCAFCETGKMGLLRQLSAREIVAQVWSARHHLKASVRNIVFMGMGEPLDNYDNVLQAIGVLTDPKGLGFAPRNITVSTCGRVNEIYRLIDDADPALNLAVSVNAPHNAARNRLMPINRTHDMATLRAAMDAYCAHPRRQILVEYVLIKDRTDALEHADALAGYLRGLRCKVNIIPYNPQSRDRFQPPSLAQKGAFVTRLRSFGYRVLVRGTKGQEIMAACGQLGGRRPVAS